MTTAPAISVCIANHNGKDVIEQCIDSVLAQIGDLALEIIVYDLWRERHRLARLRHTIQAERRAGFREIAGAFRSMPYKLRMLIRHGWPNLT